MFGPSSAATLAWASSAPVAALAEQDIGNNCKKVSQREAGTEVNLCVIRGGGGHQPGNANLLWPLLRQYTLP